MTAAAPNEDSSAISFDSVTKTYPTKSDSVNALDSVSFKVERGAVVAVVGPSGSGKTTLLNMAAGLDFPSRGSVRVGGISTTELEREPLQKFRNETVGVVFQQFFLIDHLSVFQNVMVPLIPREIPSAEKSRKILDVIAKVGLSDKADRLPSELSGGELQRVAIARGLVGDASVILADEPTGNLDSKRGSEIVGLLVAESRERQKTVLIATHDLRVLDRVDGVVYLEDGKLSRIEGKGVRTA
ncbi:MAG: ABC transporter ATP-binding protein [Thaumarchaeota archaeon]|nr:ABC transporter ATP-binding protein [Nitrososphaerota archaeon]